MNLPDPWPSYASLDLDNRDCWRSDHFKTINAALRDSSALSSSSSQLHHFSADTDHHVHTAVFLWGAFRSSLSSFLSSSSSSECMRLNPTSLAGSCLSLTCRTIPSLVSRSQIKTKRTTVRRESDRSYQNRNVECLLRRFQIPRLGRDDSTTWTTIMPLQRNRTGRWTTPHRVPDDFYNLNKYCKLSRSDGSLIRLSEGEARLRSHQGHLATQSQLRVDQVGRNKTRRPTGHLLRSSCAMPR